MSWNAGLYRKGNYASNGWTGDAANSIGIEAGRHDTQDDDFANGINDCLNKNGQNSMNANLNFGTYIPTNIGAGTAAAPAICAGNDVNTGMYSSAADEVSFATNGVVRTTIDSSGNVGVGTGGDATPEGVVGAGSKQLTVKATGNYAQLNVFSRTTGGDGSYINLCKSRGSAIGNFTLVANGDPVGIINFQGATGTEFRPCATIQAVTEGTPSATSMPGRLVFGTTPSGAILPVERVRITNDGSTQLSGRLVFLTTTTASGTGAYASAANTLNLCTDSASRLEIGSTGGVGIGGVSDGTVRLTTYGADTGSSNFSFAARSSTTYLFGVRNDGRVGIGTSVPSNQLTLSTDSAAKPTTNTWTITSDQRIKTNVQPYAKGLAEICQVNPITYDYNGRGGIPAGPGGVSILAQELQPVFPECIGSYKGKLDEGDEEDTDILNYNGHAITFALINAVKELNAKVEALEAKVENLEAVTAGL